MNPYVLIVEVVLVMISGFIIAQLTLLADLMMNPGEIFDFIRRWRANKSADVDLRKDLDTAWNLEDNDERQQIVGQIYNKIARQDKWLRRWICPVCMSAYFVGLFWVAMAFIIGWWALPSMFICWATCYYFL